MRTTENRYYDLEVFGGQCCLNPNKIAEVKTMAEIQVPDGKGGIQRALSAVRWVGAKSRTELQLTEKGKGMGMDFDVIWQALLTGSTEEVPPSVLLAEEFVKEMNMGIVTEIMIPHIQLPFYEGRIPKGMLLAWNPSNDQLGWHVSEMAVIAERNNWRVGLKHGKWLGKPYEDAIRPGNEDITSMESTWHGLYSYVKPFLPDKNIVFIHRGVDIPEKGEYRNALVHEAIKRLAKKFPASKRGLDPSHSFGSKLRDQIMEGTIEAMKMKVGNEYLYNTILVESGTSETDTGQHLLVDELEIMLKEISKFRRLRGPLLSSE